MSLAAAGICPDCRGLTTWCGQACTNPYCDDGRYTHPFAASYRRTHPMALVYASLGDKLVTPWTPAHFDKNAEVATVLNVGPDGQLRTRCARVVARIRNDRAQFVAYLDAPQISADARQVAVATCRSAARKLAIDAALNDELPGAPSAHVRMAAEAPTTANTARPQ